MTITLYKIAEDKRDVHKTLDLTTKVAELTATLKDNCTVTDPVIEITYNSSYLTANYIHIPAFGRYYFINKITVSQQRVLIEAHVDVLTTYYDQIKNDTAIVSRVENEGDANFYLSDKAFKALAYKVCATRVFPKSFTKDLNFILTVAGGQ